MGKWQTHSYIPQTRAKVSPLSQWARRGHHAPPKGSLGVVYYCSLDTPD